MDLRRARTFVTIAELGTIAKAAMRLRIAQPALSRQLAALEQDFGLRLFDRVGRGLVLTGEGERMLAECRALLGHADAVDAHAQHLRRGDTGVLKVAASPQFIEGAVAEFLPHYGRRFPDVRVDLREALGWAEIRGMLERGETHLGQNLAHAVQLGDRRFESHPLSFVDQLAASRPAFALGRGPAIEIARLAPHPLLLLDASYIFRRTFDAACRLAGIEPIVAFESRTPHSLLAMAEAGHGVAVIPSSQQTRRRRLRILALTYRGKPLREPLALFWDKRRPLPAYAAAFCEMLAAHVQQAFPVTRPFSRGPVR